MATTIQPRLTIAAGAGLAVVIASAAMFHFSRHEYARVAVTAAIVLMALFVTYGRWVLAPV